ncbi:VOC family protein [Burkholderia glumae]|uniref:VOC family protein n=1 Tax=Burkholderia glumae TaxID=337 RepID=UPI0001A4B0C5|nr:VOC family protein [Burkholderia glumae]ACR27788.1 Glyoxalase/bleomycin resistance protein/dioxygenase [Burkholderia glumae BGR1]AJY67424.1 glyoxalase-like domain protein [Burkholderia glumae LMG 2196 = ATCC 33617]QKM46102.1 hypothetical protein B7760_00087 [Burkholderia glumae]QKM53497.1 hypothetical protein CG017_01510 [Burkholderia glumae]QTP31727.1 hypothetical protein B7759_00282 [Burkholderia glumae]
MTSTAAQTTATPAAHAPRTLAWFSIPVLDLDRATRFYESMLDTTLRREISGGVPMAMFGAAGAKASDGGLVQDPHGSTPGTAGALVYLNAHASVSAALERARRAGGAWPPRSSWPNGCRYRRARSIATSATCSCRACRSRARRGSATA